MSAQAKNSPSLPNESPPNKASEGGPGQAELGGVAAPDLSPSKLGQVAVLVSALLVGGVILYFGLAPIAGFDIWWQLATGREMWAQSSSLATELFSHSLAGEPWPYKDAGFSLLLWAAYSLAGLPALVIGKAVIHLACFVLLFAACRARGVSVAAATLVVTGAYVASAFRFSERPQILSFAIALAVLALLDRCWRGRAQQLLPKPELVCCIVLCALNANLHRAGLLLPIVYGGYFAALLVDRWREGLPAPQLLRLVFGCAGWGVASVLAILCNPSGVAIIQTGVAMVDDPVLHSAIPEWWSASPANISAAAPFNFVWIAVIVLCVALPAFRRRLSVWDLALLGLALITGLRGLRFLPYIALFAALPVASILSRSQLRLAQRPLPEVLAPLAAMVCLFWSMGRGLPSAALGKMAGRYPDGAVAYIERVQPKGALYNDFSYGGYLMFSLGIEHPERRVYIDGRNDIVYPPSFIAEYLRSKVEPAVFDKIVERHDIQWLVLDTAIDQPARGFVDQGGHWSLVHVSDHALIYLRRGGVNAELAERERYRLLRPHILSQALLEASRRPAFHGPMLAELDRALAAEPDSRVLHIAKARFLSLLGPQHGDALQQSLAELERLGVQGAGAASAP